MKFPAILSGLFLAAMVTGPLADAATVSNLANVQAGTSGMASSYFLAMLPPPGGGFMTSSTGAQAANSFTTGSDGGLLESVTLILAGNGSGTFSVTLMSDAGGAPGALVASLSGNSVPTSAASHTYTAALPIQLAANTTYWIQASSATVEPNGFASHYWYLTTDLSESSPAGWSIGTQASRTLSDGVPGAWTADTGRANLFSIQTVPVPEPGGVLMAAFSAGLLLRRRRGSGYFC